MTSITSIIRKRGLEKWGEKTGGDAEGETQRLVCGEREVGGTGRGE